MGTFYGFVVCLYMYVYVYVYVCLHIFDRPCRQGEPYAICTKIGALLVPI